MENDILRNNWWNHRTCKWEYIETPTDFTNYIPQLLAALEMYQLCIDLGMTPTEAVLRVLSFWVGIEPNEDDATPAVASQS